MYNLQPNSSRPAMKHIGQIPHMPLDKLKSLIVGAHM
jgi:hypothetical protein